MTYQEWVEEGIKRGYVMEGGFSFCWTHDHPPLTAAESQVVEDADGDFDGVCVPVLRLQP